jgi:LPPG:FO 2-phospho-L-lactate transferase
MDELATLGGQTWFRLGDRDLATHLYRTQRLGEGATLTEVTGELARARRVDVNVLPVSNDPVRTMVRLVDPVEGDPGGDDGGEVDFQRWFVGLRHAPAVAAVRFDGTGSASPAPGVLDAITTADVVVIAPSNPIVSVAPVLAVPGIRDTVAARRDTVVAVSPIIAGAALKGPAATLLAQLGHEATAVGVANLYAEVAATLVIDTADAGLASHVEGAGVQPVVAPTVMSGPVEAAALARAALTAGGLTP